MVKCIDCTNYVITSPEPKDNSCGIWGLWGDGPFNEKECSGFSRNEMSTRVQRELTKIKNGFKLEPMEYSILLLEYIRNELETARPKEIQRY